MEKDKARRLTLWTFYFTAIGLLSIFFLDAEKASELFDFFKDIIIHLVVG